MTQATKPHIVIIGGGYAGVYAARPLLKAGFAVTLLDANNYFTVTPLLHEVATGGLRPDDVRFEYTSFFHHRHFRFFREYVTGVDAERQIVTTKDGEEIHYDYLIIASGSRTNFFSCSGADQYSFVLKNVDEALAIKRELLRRAQELERVKDPLQITVVGGGPTGVELAAEIDEFLETIQRRSPHLKWNLKLLNASDSILQFMPESLRKRATTILEHKGIEVKNNTLVTCVAEGLVSLGEESAPSHITIWAAGVSPSAGFTPNEWRDENGAIRVELTLQVVGQERIFALGDAATNSSEKWPRLAQVAVRQAPVVARNIIALEKGEPLEAYELKMAGMLVSLGLFQAVGEVGQLKVSGLLAWFIWRTVYWYKTPGLQNKVQVGLTWFLNLFTARNLTE